MVTASAVALSSALSFARSSANPRRFAHTSRAAWRSLVVASALAAGVHAYAEAATTLQLVVPAYFDADSDPADWNALAVSANSVPTTVILNPNSGPGKKVDSTYIPAIAKVHAAGGKVIGYVSTKAGTRALSAVVQDINLYTQFYQVDGFFIDEMTSDSKTAHVQFYQSIYNYIKGLSSTYQVMGNPGTNVPEIYASLPVADQLVVYEDNAANYAKFKASAWQANYPVSRFVHMVYNVPAASLASTMQFAAAHEAGGVYVTSLTLPNPYKKLPAYWTTETADAVIK
nr:spherulation-specific family 4 protein [Paraburkholderia phosphatilytica]